MPLLDHFQPPLSTRRHWQAFHNAWATYLASGLNERLPEGYFAEPNVQFGIEIDVAAFEENASSGSGGADQSPQTQQWTAPAPTRTIPLGVGLIVVDVVTSRQGNLHEELISRLGQPNDPPLNAPHYLTAYHPVRRDSHTHLDIWQESLEVGKALPTMPLFLRGGCSLPVEFESAYERTRHAQRITAPRTA